MPWTDAPPHAGFSMAKPWLPVDPRHLALSVETQNGATASMLNFTRAAIAARRTLPALRTGDLQVLACDDAVLALLRTGRDQQVLGVFNVSTMTQPRRAGDDQSWRIAFATDASLIHGDALPDTLAPLSGFWATR
jgi:alpha-glucosidase